MKLFELIDPQIRQKNIYASPARLTHAQKSIKGSDNLQYLGKGSYGMAAQRKKHPNSVIKTGVVGNAETDGYLRYIKTVGKLASSNPYFPRVYDIRIYNNTRDDDDKDMYVAEIEKLTKADAVEPEVMLAIGNRAFHDFESEVNADLRDHFGHRQGKASPEGRKSRPMFKLDTIPQGPLLKTLDKSFTVTSALVRLLQQSLQGDMTRVKDPLLKYALHAIKRLSQDPIFAKEKGHIDMHGSNLMVRYGPGGGQLVITDPLI
jgi:hypothetical protein